MVVVVGGQLQGGAKFPYKGLPIPRYFSYFGGNLGAILPKFRVNGKKARCTIRFFAGT